MVSLADLRARNVVPVWQEAVAVVQELIQTVKATTGSAELLPDLEHVALIPNGDVVALPGSPEPGAPVRHAAVMLKLLLEGVPSPPELESFITRNVSEPPQYDTVAEFSRNLAFFERPGRRADVERLVGRAVAAEQTSRADEELRRLKERASEVTQAMPAPEFLQQPPKQVKTIPIPLVAVAGVATIAAALWIWTRVGAPAQPAAPEAVAESTAPPAAPPTPASTTEGQTPAGQTAGTAPAETPAPTPQTQTAAQAPTGATPPPPEAPRSLVTRAGDAVRSAVNTLLGANPPAPAAAPVPTATAPVPTPPTRRRSRRPRPAQPAPVVAATETPAAAPAPVVAEPEPATVAPPPAMPTTIDRSLEAPVEVFTSNDEAVTPPVIVRPVLPKEPPPDVPPEDVGTIEVVVDENGDVLNVKLISPANRFRERFLVSAAKMWKFRPAYKDGRPVRYKTRVRLTI